MAVVATAELSRWWWTFILRGLTLVPGVYTASSTPAR